VKKFNNLDELNQERKELFGKFEGEVPKCLVELFDKKDGDLKEGNGTENFIQEKSVYEQRIARIRQK